MEQLFSRENIYAALAFLGLLLIAVYIPLGLLALMFLSIPFIYLAKNNSEQEYFILVGVILLLALILAMSLGVFFTILAASVAYVIVRFSDRKSFTITFLYTLLVAIGNILLALIISRQLFDLDFSAYYLEQLNLIINSEQGFMVQLSPEQSGELIQTFTALIDSIVTGLPFIIIMTGALYALANYYFATKILPRFSLSLPPIPSPREWGFPKSVIYAYLIVAFLYLFSGSSDFLYALTYNLFQIFSIVLIIQGFSLIYIFIEQRKMSRQWLILAVVGVFLPILNQAIQVVGIVDLAFDLRKRILRG